VLVAVLTGISVRAQFPYNYIYASFLFGMCAVRGYVLAIRILDQRYGLGRYEPLLYLLPLAVVPNQLNFVSHTTGNEHQLALLDLIQQYTVESDAVIDNAGGALFRPGASYFYQHGGFHRILYSDYFRNELVADYRRSEAKFWIQDMRSTGLPRRAQRYLKEHYVPVGETSLRALGFEFSSDPNSKLQIEFEVIRSGDYFLYRVPDSEGQFDPSPPIGIEIDGASAGRLIRNLEKGQHVISLEPGSGSHTLSILPPEAIPAPNPELEHKQHSRFFEYFVHD
jgi:hypothetical protein